MKTIKEWFKTIKSKKIRSNALKNISESTKNSKEPYLSEAIMGGFSWNKSPEGFKYWNDIYNSQVIKEKV